MVALGAASAHGFPFDMFTAARLLFHTFAAAGVLFPGLCVRLCAKVRQRTYFPVPRVRATRALLTKATESVDSQQARPSPAHTKFHSLAHVDT